ncbi:MAG: molybdenum ABC transporter ATP-binding protein [Henriciella sp.]|uniref:molybdenum ABC transporter ATP-binding protein n=1 Tax=Henriciella sp. TaxID=1968823 RepID=UPI003C795E15
MSAEKLFLSFGLWRGSFHLRVTQELVLDGITAVFGPSGSGKTSLLRAIAGLDQPSGGTIALGDELWFRDMSHLHVKPHRRGVGYVFQDGRLFGHLSVRGNLNFSHKRSRTPESAISFDDVVDATGLAPLLDRTIETLSGGEARRVALARAILSRPRLLLLDEPLTGLDRTARRDLLPYLKQLPERFAIPTLFVSHDIEEVIALADRVLVLSNGYVQAHGPLQEVMSDLDLAPLMDEPRHGSVIQASVSAHDPDFGVTQLRLDGETLSLPLDETLAIGAPLRLFINASDISIATEAPRGLSIRNIIPAEIVSVSDGMGGVLITLKAGSSTLRAEITRAAAHDLRLAPGQKVFALIKSMSFAR